MSSPASGFDAAIFDADVFGLLRATNAAVGRGGTMRIAGRCYRATRANTLLEELSADVLDGTVEVDLASDIPATFAATLKRPGVFAPFTDHLAPFLTISYPDQDGPGWLTLDRQMGLYVVMPPPMTDRATHREQRVEGVDLTWRLASDQYGKAVSSPKAASITSQMRAVAESAGISRHAIPELGVSLRKGMTWDAGTSKLERINDLGREGGCYPVWMDWTGRLTTRVMSTRADRETTVAFSSARGDIHETVETDPDWGALCNRVIVIRHDAGDVPIVVSRDNTDPRSPVSQSPEGIGTVVAKIVEDSAITTTADAVTRAKAELEAGAMVTTRKTLRVTPTPLLDIHDTVLLDVRNDAGLIVADGAWSWDRLVVGFDTSHATMEIRCSRLEAFGAG